MLQQWQVPVGGETSRAVFEPGRAAGRGTLFVCAHGAGGHMEDRGLLAVSEQLAQRGIGMVRFNFLYREQGSRRPDPMPRLRACLVAVIARARAQVKPRRLIIGGRSMGGHAASMLAADGYSCDGLLLLAYPLHPAGKPTQLRDAHLARIQVPTLCLNGTRDPLCTREPMDRTVAGLAGNWTMHWLAGADHSFHVLKSSGRTDAEVLAEVGDAVSAWEAALPA